MYYIVYGLLYTISLLPLRVLYLISDFAYFLLYYIIGYRKQVVFSNLKQAFPEKSEEERKKIAKKFYRNFTDNFIEFIKLISASTDYINKHFYGDYSLLNVLNNQGKRGQILLAHNFNWEWGCLAVASKVKQLFLVVYMPIGSKPIDKLFMKIRSKTGAILLPATDMRNAIIPYRNKLYLLILVADQNPGNPKSALWYNFFGKPTPFVKAPESGARRGNAPVLFTKFIKERRGYYKVFFEMGEENPAALNEGELTRKYVDYLHDFISEYPEMWLWSHRRWKWEWKEEYGKVIS
ncbi:MAG TPA: lysophospholipid acyltransferase family protein [Chitinophagaceae bacterium]|jgi:KDO2-lipid IV(A) lauroyltransferase|nr:lysophospholipid acyltransferase family protein [Chitinophagaceae bacterium]